MLIEVLNTLDRDNNGRVDLKEYLHFVLGENYRE